MSADTQLMAWTPLVTDVIGTSTWPDNHDKSVPCATLIEVQGEEFVPVIPLTCGENIELN